MMRRMKHRVSLSLDGATVDYLNRRASEVTHGNVSAYIDRMVRAAALGESVAAHVAWYATRPKYAENAEAERGAV
jgi:hypothetical protein